MSDKLKIDRYDVTEGGGTFKCPGGELVYYSDVEALLAENAALRAQLPSLGGEAVAAQTRFRRPEKGAPDWSPWHETRVSESNPAWCIDSQGFEVEYRLLYASPADKVAVILASIPECPADQNPGESYASGWNECKRYMRALLAKP